MIINTSFNSSMVHIDDAESSLLIGDLDSNLQQDSNPLSESGETNNVNYGYAVIALAIVIFSSVILFTKINSKSIETNSKRSNNHRTKSHKNRNKKKNIKNKRR